MRTMWIKILGSLAAGAITLAITIIRAGALPLQVGVVVMLAALSCAIWFLFQKRKDGPIQVFPPKTVCEQYQSDFHQDGAVQKKGFLQAEVEAIGVPGALKIAYCDMYESDQPGDLLKKIKDLYKGGSKYFVLTMSSKAEEILPAFKDWRNSFTLKWGNVTFWTSGNAPVLIITVASAPKLADAKNGIVRWYVRSEEESRLLANYLGNKEFHTAAAFGITPNDGNPDSTYAREAISQFAGEFPGRLPQDKLFYTTAKTAKNHVKKFLDENNNGDGIGVFVVGYGEMVKNTISELLTRGYAGCIVCTSTLTDPHWRPAEDLIKNGNARILTVVPKLKQPNAHLVGDNRNVVFFFAKKTLLRVIKLSANGVASAAFLESWMDGKDIESEELDQEYLKGGDILVRLKVVTAESLQ